MAYDIRVNSDGEMLVLPLELPLYDGTTEDLGRQALVSLCSFLRHAAVADAYLNEGQADIDILEHGETSDSFDQHMASAASQLSSTMMALASLANLYNIDIMQEIWEMPWKV